MANNTVSSQHAQVETDLSGMPFREPIVDDYSPDIHDLGPGEDYRDVLGRIREKVTKKNAAQDAKADRQWLALTEAARRAIISNPEVRHAAAGFTSEPLSEQLPQQAVDTLVSQDARTGRLAKLARKTLGVVLEQRQVPDIALTPDIKNASPLHRKDDEAKALSRIKKDLPGYYDRSLEDTRKRVELTPGVTSAERRLVARRYRYARDVKMLGLMAELQDQPFENTTINESGLITHELQSGTRLVITEEAFEATPDLLDPQNWQSRHQLKDRVYVVQVDGHEYILKERKTPRHTDTKEHGHIDGLTSQQEFETAKQFADLGIVEHGDIRLHWEKPLGYVEFPDGYQFCLFESEPGLQTEEPKYELMDAILNAGDAYRDEYELVRQEAKKIYDERDDLIPPERERTEKPKRIAISRAARRHKELIRNRPKPDDLTFREFAEIKAIYLIEEAKELLLTQTMWDKGYTNSDLDGYAFRVGGGEQPSLEIIGFDFEYYAHSPTDASESKHRLQQRNLSGESAFWGKRHVAESRGIAVAASYAMMERMGLQLPSRRA